VEAKFTLLYPALPPDWLDRIDDLVEDHGIDVKTKGRGPGSLEDSSTAGLDYRVVNGEAIELHAEWLWEIYTSESMLGDISAAVGEPVKVSPHTASAINVNHLAGRGGRYELHVDGQPYSAVLMCDTCTEETGGRLLLGHEAQPIETSPGMLVVFDGSVIPHAVEPLKHGLATRTSLPMVYVPERAVERPEGLDGYLYGQ
jgi:hypothetical protein